MSEIYHISGLEHSHGGRLVLNVESLTVSGGEIAGITGPNGSGKSTLMAVMAFLLKPDLGRVRFLGRAVDFAEPSLRRQAVLLPQDPCLLRRTVWGNVSYGLSVRGLKDEGLVRRAMDMVGLDPQRFAKRWWWELSGGEIRRVGLAARLALSPEALLLDEPTANLDPESARLVRLAILAEVSGQQSAAVVISHDQQWLESFVTALYRLDPDQGLKTLY